MKASLLFLATLSTFAAAGCDMLTDVGDVMPNVDGTYHGDFQVIAAYYTYTPGGSASVAHRSVSGAVTFTIQGTRVITTPAAGDGEVIWDPVNRAAWVEFESITSSNETKCSRWRYYGGLTEGEQFLRGDGGINCLAPEEDFITFEHTAWTVQRQ